MKKSVFNLISKEGYDKEQMEDVLSLVVDLLHENIEITRQEAPNATRSIYEMEIAVQQVRNLTELFETDPNIEYLMSWLEVDEDDINELIEETGKEPADLVDLVKGEYMKAFDDEEQAFNWVHEDQDREELLALLYRQQSNYNDENEYQIGGKVIYINE